jgi:hypothetical protein
MNWLVLVRKAPNLKVQNHLIPRSPIFGDSTLMTNVSKQSSADNIRLHGAPLSEAPHNERGVVFLFARLQEKYGVRVEKIRAGFPDCLARKIRGDKNEIIRIEFEYKSANFKMHGHKSSVCDWIVCWEHNWPDVPRNLRIIELRQEFGLDGTYGSIPRALSGMTDTRMRHKKTTRSHGRRARVICC